jgi:hypothetical protein
MIAFTCPGCHKRLTAKDALAGKRRSCPGCGASICVPRHSFSPLELGWSLWARLLTAYYTPLQRLEL